MPSPRRFSPVRPSPESGADAGTSAARGRQDNLPLGRLLVHAKKITAKQLEEALALQRKTFQPLGRILRDEYNLLESDLIEALRKQTHIPRIYLRFFPAAPETTALLDPEFCRQHEAIAFEKLGSLLCVAFSKPPQRGLARQIEASTELEVKPYSAPWEDIRKKLNLEE